MKNNTSGLGLLYVHKNGLLRRIECLIAMCSNSHFLLHKRSKASLCSLGNKESKRYCLYQTQSSCVAASSTFPLELLLVIVKCLLHLGYICSQQAAVVHFDVVLLFVTTASRTGSRRPSGLPAWLLAAGCHAVWDLVQVEILPPAVSTLQLWTSSLGTLQYNPQWSWAQFFICPPSDVLRSAGWVILCKRMSLLHSSMRAVPCDPAGRHSIEIALWVSSGHFKGRNTNRCHFTLENGPDLVLEMLTKADRRERGDLPPRGICWDLYRTAGMKLNFKRGLLQYHWWEVTKSYC